MAWTNIISGICGVSSQCPIRSVVHHLLYRVIFFETLQPAMVAKFLVPLPLVKKPVAKDDDVKVDPDEVYRRQIRLLMRLPLEHLKKKLEELQELSDARA